MATRPKKSNGILDESGIDGHSKRKQESGLSTYSQSSKDERSKAGHSDGYGKAQRKAQQPCKNNSVASMHGADSCISTAKETLGKHSAKNKNEEILRETANEHDVSILSTKAKETTTKNCRRSKSVEQNDLEISLVQTICTNATQNLGCVNDKMQNSLVKPKAPKETDPKQCRRSKSTELPDLPISLNQTNYSNKTKSTAEQTNVDNKTEPSPGNNDPRRRNSKIKENEDTANSAGDRGEIRQQSIRSNSLPNSNLSKHLRDTVKSLTMKMEDISNAAKKVNKIIDIITKSELTKNHPLFKSIEKLSTGSYYEGVKISNPNEFDIMLKIEFESYQTIELTNIDEGGAFYTLAFRKRKPKPMEKYIDEDGNIAAKHILDDFRDLVNRVLQQSGRPALLERKDPSSPAVTLNISNGSENISVDLVLALHIRQWPEKASNGMNIDSWLGTKQKLKFKLEPCYMVAKQANLGKTDNKDTWRISFSNIEKEIMSFHGSAKTCCESQGSKCCRKQCLKLMKYLLEQLKKSGNRKMNQFCSYHAKTALLHACTHYPNDEDWRLEDLDVCFNRYVAFFQESLKKCSLPNFFIPSHNLLSSDSINKSSCKYLFEELERQKTQNYPIFLSIPCQSLDSLDDR